MTLIGTQETFTTEGTETRRKPERHNHFNHNGREGIKHISPQINAEKPNTFETQRNGNRTKSTTGIHSCRGCVLCVLCAQNWGLIFVAEFLLLKF